MSKFKLIFIDIIFIVLFLCECGEKKIPSEIENIINGNKYYNHVLYIDYFKDTGNHALLPQDDTSYAIIPDKWNDITISRVSLSAFEDDYDFKYFYIPKSVVYFVGDLNVYFNDTETIYYGGSKEDWEKIEFNNKDDSFDYDKFMKQVTIIYNSDFDINAGDED